MFICVTIILFSLSSKAFGQLACQDGSRPEEITEFPQVIVSPGYDQPYPPSSLCEWLLTAPADQAPQLSFTAFRSEDCTDYLEGFDGPDDTAPSLGRICGDLGTDVPPLRATVNQMFLRFVSDANDDGSTGFQANANLYDPNDPCGGDGIAILDDPEGSFTSPNYPGNYPVSTICQWIIRAPVGQRIELDIGQVDMEDNCDFDGLEVYEGASNAGDWRGRWYGEDYPPTFRSVGNELYVFFESDISITGSGFNATYRAVADETLKYD